MDEKMLIEAMRQMMAEQSKQMADMMDTKLAEALEPIREDLAEVKQRATKIEVTLENDIAKRLNEKFTLLDEVAERVEDIQITVNAMEAVTKQNCTDIKQLRAVK